MATVTSSKRQLTHTSNTYESNGDVTIGGNLNINGTTTTIDTANLLVEDKNIIIGDVSSPSDTTADGGGITLKGASDKTINWVNSTDSWTSNQRFSAPNLTLTGLTTSSETTALLINGSNQVVKRTLGSNAFNSTSFLTSYTETDTLATVTGRGNTTSQAITITNQLSTTNTIFARKDNVSNYTNANIRLDSFGGSSSTVGIGFHISGQLGRYLRMNSSGVLAWEGSTVWHAGNDGSGSGLDADLLDGNHASAFATASHSHAASDITSGTLVTARIPSLAASKITSGTLDNARLDNTILRHRGTLDLTSSSGGHNGLPFDDAHTETRVAEYGTRVLSYTGASATMLTISTGGSASVFQIGAHYNGNDFYMRTRTDGSNWQTWKKLWHSGNDGSGSGLDADTVDGVHASSFLRSDASDTFSGKLTGTATNENLEVGGIRGTAKGSQTGDYIHLYERVHIGGPSGWGHSTHGAPSNGLGVWGAIDLGMGGSGALQVDGTTVLTNARVLQNVTANAGVITSGTFADARIPSLAASKITSGTLSTDRIPDTLELGDTDSTAQGILKLSAYVANKESILKTTNGNLHIDSPAGHQTYINYYTGSGVTFGNGNTGVSGASISTGGVITATGGNSTNWNTAYTDRNKWDGGSTGLNASTGRTSLGLGSAATSASTAFATANQGTSAETAFGWGNHASAGYAPLASPALTGNPTAPTQAANNNSTRIATTAYVQTELTDLIGAAPAALDTLSELADAINDDSTFSSTVTTALGNRLRVDTASQGLNSTQKSNARTNLGLGSAAIQNTSAFMGASGMAANTDVYMNFRVLRNSNSTTANDGMYIGYGNSNNGQTRIFGGGSTGVHLAINATNMAFNNNAVWHAGNDGSGSGLDADTVDGVHASSFLRSDASDSYSGDLSVNGITFRDDSNVVRNFKMQPTATSTDVGLSMYLGNGSHSIQLYGTANQYGFLDGNWANWDIRKTKNGAFEVDEGSGLQRVFNAGYHPNADTLTTARTITLAGDVTGNVSFNGSADVSITAVVGNDTHDHTGLLKRADIGSSVNLNGYTTDGYYHQNGNAGASSGSNYPEAKAGMLTVQADGVMVYQKYQLYNGTGTYHRSYYNGTWYAWRRLFADNHHPNADTLTTARTIAGTSFNGSANIDISYNNLTNKPTIPSAYSLPAASSSTRGGVKIGFSESGKNYPVELDSSEKMYVNVPWVDTNTDTNTTYTAGRGLDLSGTEFQLETDLRDSISYIGYDSNDYVQWSNNSYFRSVVNGSERFRVNTSGIDVNGTTTSSGFLTDTSSTQYNLLTRNHSSNTLYVQAAQSGGTQPIATFRYGSTTANAGSEVLAVRRNSSYFVNTKLGVGTTSPSTALHVNGTITHTIYNATSLPSASPAGQRAFAYSFYPLATSHGSVVSTNGSYVIPVYSDGSSWRAG